MATTIKKQWIGHKKIISIKQQLILKKAAVLKIQKFYKKYYKRQLVIASENDVKMNVHFEFFD